MSHNNTPAHSASVATAVDIHRSNSLEQDGRPSNLLPSENTAAMSGSASHDVRDDSDMKETTAPSHSGRATVLARGQSEFTPSARPPDLNRFTSERPQPNNTHSLFGRGARSNPTRQKKPQMNRQVTLSFDPDSSDSSSSSDDDDEPPKKPSGVDGQASSEPKPQRKRRSESGPFSRFKIDHEQFNTKGRVSKQDGRLKLSINETLNSGWFAKTLGAGLRKHLEGSEAGENPRMQDIESDREKIQPDEDIMEDPERRIKLNIVVIVIGSRGDIQPFIRIGKILKEDYGHRVRIATHPAFKKFVEEDSGLEFFSVGGNPSELMAFMVKNPGLIPNFETIREGEIGRRRAAMYEMFLGMWRACINSTDDENDKANLKMMGSKGPFVADAIIANPPSFAPPHIAERLGIPLHMMFTFPYTPTVQFPHPLANIKVTNVDPGYTNFMSYPLVEMMTWQGLGDLINRFRKKVLWLDEVSTLWAPGQLYRLKVPYTYMWSPSLVPKPKDWGPEVDISGYVFLDLASSFKPPEDLVKFLEAGPPPVYIGFGSIVVDDPDQFTELIFEAVKQAGVRALVSKGWGGFGSNSDTPDNVYMLENTPHDWLFPRVSAVVHHGGAGTTAAGLKCGKPTMIVPFFGDQPFWGAMLAKAKAGAHECTPYKKLTAEKLAEGIKQCLTEEARENAKKIAEGIEAEGDGALNAVRSFHRSLPLLGDAGMRCQILNNRCAAWKLKNSNVQLSTLAAELLVEWKKVKWNEMRLVRHYEWNDFGGPGEPVTGIWGAVVTTLADTFTGVGLVPVKMVKSARKREKYHKKKKEIEQKQQQKKDTLAKANAEHATETQTNGQTNGKTLAKEQNGRPKLGQRHSTTLSQLSAPDEPLAEEWVKETGHGFKKTGAAIIRSPMHLSLAIAQGFHNAPRLYGDETVRRPPRITGFYSGMRAGRDEFVYGIHDGVAGLWQQPIYGAKDGGVLGAIRGVGMGIGGLVLKDVAAVLGPPAYFMKGLNEEAMKKHQPTHYLRRARIIQGQKEVSELGPPVKRRKSGAIDDGMKRQQVEIQVSRQWDALQEQIARERNTHQAGIKGLIMGTNLKKEGKRKSEDTRPKSSGTAGSKTNGTANLQPRKAPTAPIPQLEKGDSSATAKAKSMLSEEKVQKKDESQPLSHAEKGNDDTYHLSSIPNIVQTESGAPIPGASPGSEHDPKVWGGSWPKDKGEGYGTTVGDGTRVGDSVGSGEWTEVPRSAGSVHH